MELTLSISSDLTALKTEILEKVGDAVKEKLNRAYPSKSQWERSPVVSDAVIVHNSAQYLAWIDQGTGIYGPRNQMIEPKNSAFLHWINASGDDIFAKSVRGIRPKPFIEQAVDEGVKEGLHEYQ